MEAPDLRLDHETPTERADLTEQERARLSLRLHNLRVRVGVSGRSSRAIPYGIVVLCALAAAAIMTTVALPVDAPTPLRLAVFGGSGGAVLLIGVAVLLVRAQRPTRR